MNAKNAAGVRPKSWPDFLKKGAAKLTGTSKKIVNRLIKERDYLTACEVLKRALGRQDYTDLLNDEFRRPRFKAAAIHKSIFQLDASIVATPNIDKIYDVYAGSQASGTIKVKCFYDDDVADSIRGSERIILKVHGTVDSAHKVVFTRAEYAAARNENSTFYAILDALIITHTFIFLGCGGNDPDVRLLLENYNFRHKYGRSHYMVMPKDALSAEEVDILEETMNLKILPYSPVKNHSQLTESVRELVSLVETERDGLANNRDW